VRANPNDPNLFDAVLAVNVTHGDLDNLSSAAGMHDDDADESAIVVEKAFRGADFLYHLRTDSGIEVLCLASSHHNHKINERIGIRLDVDHLVTFSRG